MRDLGSGVAISPNEFCRRAEGQVQDVVEDEYLAVAAGARADTDCGSRDFAGDQVRDFSRNSFQENTGYAGAVEGRGVAHELLDVGQRLALDFVSAHAVHGLRSQANVTSDRNFGVNYLADQISAFLTAFELHDLRASLLNETSGIANGFFRIHVKGAIRHVSDQQSVLDSPPRGANVMQHFVHGQR